ncbi:MAG: DUF1010 domain-containing protein [Gammaproteobacteria bacterium]|nr:DUF1010 domain-containing protein [Gammaproteobacteria bacterium]
MVVRLAGTIGGLDFQVFLPSSALSISANSYEICSASLVARWPASDHLAGPVFTPGFRRTARVPARALGHTGR